MTSVPPPDNSSKLGNILVSWYKFLAFTAVGGVIGGIIVWINNPLKALGLIVGAFLALIVVIRVELGFVVLAFITHSNLSTILVDNHGFFSIAKILVLLIAVGVVVRYSLRMSLPPNLGPIAILISLYGLAGIVSLFGGDYPKEGLLFLSDLLKNSIIAVLAVVLIRKWQMFRAVFWALIISGTLLGTVAIIQYVTDTYDSTYWGLSMAPVEHILGELDDHRLAGTVGDPNYFAMFQLILLPFAIDRFFSEKNLLLKLLAAYAIGAILFTVILSYSRGGFLGIMVMTLALLLLKPNLTWKVMASAAIGVCILLYTPQSNYIQRMLTLEYFSMDKKKKPISEASFSGRKSEILVAAMIFLDHPILGVGVGNYERNYHEYAREIYIDFRKEKREAHCLYLEILAESGLVGFIPFGLLIWYMFQTLFRARMSALKRGDKELERSLTALTVSLIGLLTGHLFLHNAWPRIFWLFIGLAFSTAALKSDGTRRGIHVDSAANRNLSLEKISEDEPT